MADTLTTELEAVNIMLQAVGESPVAALSGTLPIDVSIARAILTETRRRVLMLGWDVNTENEVRLSLDVDGNAVIPSNALKVKVSESASGGSTVTCVQRGARLYDKKNHTYVFAAAPAIDIVYLLTWDELPEQARAYIALKAARIYQQRTIGSPELSGYTSADEMEALVAWREADSDSAHYNIFNNADGARFYQYRRI